MNEQQKCGKGLADRSALPAKFGELIAAMIQNLEAHQETLEVTDENGKLELRAYVKLAQEFRCVATPAGDRRAHGWIPRPADGETRSSEDGSSQRRRCVHEFREPRKRSARAAAPVDRAGSNALRDDDWSSRRGLRSAPEYTGGEKIA
jgi:hypothetical protein